MQATEINKEELVNEARSEFSEEWTAAQVKEWWAKWYGKVGHKRLGRILLGK